MNHNKYIDLLLESKLVPNETVYVMVQNMHRNPEDFDEGDIAQRLDEYDQYKLKEVPIKDLNLNEWDVRDYLVKDFIKKIKEHPDYPPIVVSHDMSIIDGIHRVNALAKLGHKKVKAYVGVKK